MSLQIDNERFKAAHESFCEYMQQAGGEPFTNFQHPFLIDDEIEYKRIVYGKAKDMLSLPKWHQWIDQAPESIIEATKNACAPNVSANLLEHRYGWRNSSEAALYRAEGKVQKKELAQKLYDFFKGGPSTPDAFGPRFDAFANYLREQHLSCKWPFLAYLAFLLNPDLYFPITPTRFDLLLKHYGVDKTVSGYVSWERYSLLLALAGTLRSKLAAYGPADALETQSYMWTVSWLIEKQKVPKRPVSEAPDFDTAFAARVRRAEERERIGVRGEQFVYNHERTKLREARRLDLAERVQPSALLDDNAGYDVLSFDTAGNEIHIEVKTTASSPDQDPGFWLSENERLQAEQDSHWCIYRVWNINSTPSLANLGNIIKHLSDEWDLNPSTWSVRRIIS
jgi:hypothetical protein